MDNISKTDGLLSIFQKIIQDLDYETLLSCRLVNRIWKVRLDNPKFWIERVYLEIEDKVGVLHPMLEQRWWVILKTLKNMKTKLEINEETTLKQSMLMDWLRSGYLESEVTKCIIKLNYLWLSTPNDGSYSILVGNCQPIFVATLYENEAFIELIKHHYKNDLPIEFNLHGILPIHYAAQMGNLMVVKSLSQAMTNPLMRVNPGPGVGKVPMPGSNAIQIAAKRGHTDIVKYLWNNRQRYHPKPLDLNEMDGVGKTPIYLAAKSGRLDLLKFLVPNSVVPFRPTNDGENPFHIAAERGHEKVFEYLCHFTENPNEPDTHNFTPLHAASMAGKLGIVQILAHKVKNPLRNFDSDGFNALHYAITNGYLEIVEYFVNFTHPWEVPTMSGETPIYLAAEYDRLEILKYLLEKAKDPFLNWNHENPIEVAYENKNINVVRHLQKFLVETREIMRIDPGNGFNPLMQIKNGKNAIHIAAEKGDLQMVKKMCKFTKNGNDPTDDGKSAIYLAAANGQNHVVKFLIEYLDANRLNPLNIIMEEKEAIFIAAQNGGLKVIRHLVQKVITVHNVEVIGEAIRIASENGHKSITNYLEEVLRDSYERTQRRHKSHVKYSTALMEQFCQPV